MALLSVAQSMRSAVRLRRRSSTLEQLQHVPPNLRTPDPSVSLELAAGTLGLPSGLLNFARRDMYLAALEDPAKARDLFGFAWLVHLDAARSEQSERQIRGALIAWARNPACRSAVAAEPAVMARRALSLLSHADAGLPGATPAEFDAVMDLVAAEFALLAREVKRMPVTAARLTAHIALAAYALSAGQSEGQMLDAERRLAVELQRQIHRDGGHISRNPAALLEAALDLVPLRRLYLTCQRTVPEAVTAALGRMAVMLQRLQMPDRALARFNGMGATPTGDLLTVLRQLAPGAPQPKSDAAADTGYVRATAGASVLLFDSGPGAESLPGEAPFAGALSFEFGAGAVSLIVNCGAGRDVPAKANMRASASHSAMVFAGASSGPMIGGRAGYVRCALEAGPDGGQRIVAANDGYKVRHSVVHHRALALSGDGRRLMGVDRLDSSTRTASPGPYAVHFHLHPSVYVEPAADRRSVRLTAGDGSVWSFACDEVVPAIEASIYFASASGPKPTLQLVLRAVFPETQSLSWRLDRLQSGTLPVLSSPVVASPEATGL